MRSVDPAVLTLERDVPYRFLRFWLYVEYYYALDEKLAFNSEVRLKIMHARTQVVVARAKALGLI